jgi:hypothetical protein
MSREVLYDLKSIKGCPAGARVTFRACVLRSWEVGGLRMCLVGDASALSRVEIGQAAVQEGKSYEVTSAVVRTYPGGWHSASLDEGSRVAPLNYDIEVPQDEAYIDRTFKILAGVQRKKGRAAGRLPSWRHPASRDPYTG